MPIVVGVKAMSVQPDSWIESAPSRCSASLDIAASPADIWAVLAEHESWPDWFGVVKEVTVTGAASGVGARRRVRLSGLELDEEFVAWDVGERYAFAVVAASRGMFTSISERIIIDDLGSGHSRVTYTQAFAPKWWFALPFRLLIGQFRHNLTKALDGIATQVG